MALVAPAADRAPRVRGGEDRNPAVGIAPDQWICRSHPSNSKNWWTFTPPTTAAKHKSKREALAVFERMMKFTGATTLADLTTDALKAWRADIEKNVESASTKIAYYSRIKNDHRIWSEGGDRRRPDQCGGSIAARCWTPDKIPQVDPRPISRDAFPQTSEIEAGQPGLRSSIAASICACISTRFWN